MLSAGVLTRGQVTDRGERHSKATIRKSHSHARGTLQLAVICAILEAFGVHHPSWQSMNKLVVTWLWQSPVASSCLPLVLLYLGPTEHGGGEVGGTHGFPHPVLGVTQASSTKHDEWPTPRHARCSFFLKEHTRPLIGFCIQLVGIVREI